MQKKIRSVYERLRKILCPAFHEERSRTVPEKFSDREMNIPKIAGHWNKFWNDLKDDAQLAMNAIELLVRTRKCHFDRSSSFRNTMSKDHNKSILLSTKAWSSRQKKFAHLGDVSEPELKCTRAFQEVGALSHDTLVRARKCKQTHHLLRSPLAGRSGTYAGECRRDCE